MRFLLLASLLAACSGTADDVDVVDPLSLGECPTSEPLFGRPNATTGLSAEQCGPTCACSEATFTPPVYTAADVAALRALTLTEPLTPLTADPYEQAAPSFGADVVCGVKVEGDLTHYALHTYDDGAAAVADGAQVTHGGPCGLCSGLADLAVYIEEEDLTAPVRQCGLDNFADDDGARACLRDLGFTEVCAEIWFYNMRHTQSACAAPCLASLDDPYQEPDGSLNDCLQCDEDESGPVFKAIAGRTRRNSGLPNALCRPCSEVLPLVHRYAP